MPEYQIGHSADIKGVFDAHEAELRLVEDSIREMFDSEVFFIPLIGRHIQEGGGKRIRPLFLLSSARLAGYGGSDHITLSGIIECIHTASLLHDDVVDGAELRRGRPAAHSVWGNQVVILVGDFLYSNALKRAVSFRNQRIMEALSEATTMMTEGEILQLQKSSDIGITEEEYLKIISSKTGILISAACRIAAILGGCGSEKEDALASFGLKAGIAFQMADDILDYMAEEGALGKKLGKDLEEGKITLPLIRLLESVSEPERDDIKNILEQGLPEDGLKKILSLFERNKILVHCLSEAGKLVEEAKGVLDAFPPAPAREELYVLADYALQRQK